MKNNTAQITLTYAVLIVVISLGLIIMAFYIKRAIQGRLHQSADAFGGGEVYDSQKTHIENPLHK